MKNPYLSVICPTMRVGGLDVLAHGLGNQTFEDFELILVDALRSRRPDADIRLMNACVHSVFHCEPVGNPFPLNAFCRYANTGLLHANGEVIVFVTDYTFLPPDCLARHAEFHRADKTHKGGFMGPHQYLDFPQTKASFGAGYDRHEVDRYAADVAAGRLDDVMWSLFKRDFGGEDAESLPIDPVYGWADPKLRMNAGPIEPVMFHGKNESVRAGHVFAVDGWEERQDGAHCFQDSEFADRLTTLRGIEWVLDPTNVAFIVNPRRCFPFPRRLYNEERNERIWHERKAAGFAEPVQSILRKDEK